jgi:hypothetical protein
MGRGAWIRLSSEIVSHYERLEGVYATASLAAGRRPWGMRTSARAATTAPQGRWRVREGGKLRVDRDRSGTVGGDFVTPHRRPQRDSQDSLA